MASYLPVPGNGRSTDRRRDMRIATARLVRVAHDGCTSYARCRDISPSGVKLSLLEPIAPGERVEVAFSSRVRLRGHVTWVEGPECGILFDREIDCAALLTTTALEARAETDRLQAGGGHGIGPAPDAANRRFRPGLGVTLMLESGREERAVLDWTMNRVAGLTLDAHPRSDQPVIIDG